MTGYTAPCLLKVPLNPGKEKCFLPLLHFSLEDVLKQTKNQCDVTKGTEVCDHIISQVLPLLSETITYNVEGPTKNRK